MPPVTPTVLVILDGFGYRKELENNAVAQAHTPHLDSWFQHYPSARLQASGTAVGLPKGYIGNSEVGHLTIGAGRVVPQAITFIHEAIVDTSFYDNPVLIKALATVRATTNRLHIVGLCSDAGVHSDIEHVYAFLDAAHRAGIRQVFLHLFLDGRDVPPRSAHTFLAPLSEALSALSFGKIGSLHGRFYAMDRNNHFDRTQKSYDVLVGTTKPTDTPWQQILATQYANGITDEFIEPVLLDANAAIKPGDGIIFFNVRPDRIRQLTATLVDPQFKEFPVRQIDPACFVTPVDYGLNLPAQVMFPEPPLQHTLKDELAAAHKRMFVIAETEKYAHVTYFFTGMREQPVAGETRHLVPSLLARTYAQTPQMSAAAITEAVLATVDNPYDFYLINYANADMVGHSGDLAATVKAIECLDAQLAQLYEAFVQKLHGTLYITADHGKAEDMFDATVHQPRTAHTCNLVPFLMIKGEPHHQPEKLPLKELADIAPFILKNMGLTLPDEMRQE